MHAMLLARYYSLTRHPVSQALNGLQEADATQQAAPGLDHAPEVDVPDPPGIMVLVSQPPYCLTVEEASKLTIPAFSALWTVSLHTPALVVSEHFSKSFCAPCRMNSSLSSCCPAPCVPLTPQAIIN